MAQSTAQIRGVCPFPNQQNQKLVHNLSGLWGLLRDLSLECSSPRCPSSLFPDLTSSRAGPDTASLTQQQAPTPGLVVGLPFRMLGGHRPSPHGRTTRVPHQGLLPGHWQGVASQ